MMKKILLLFMMFTTINLFAQDDAEMINNIFDEILTNGEAYQNLEYLTTKIGGRLSGSPQAAAAVDYTQEVMEAYGFDKVWLQEVFVPHWERGDVEIGKIVNSRKQGTIEVNVTALGNAVGTGPGGIVAPIIEVQNFDDLKALGEGEIEGKIVFFNRPMDPTLINTFMAYGGAANQRGAGPSEAAKYGAVGVVVRSLTTALDDNPHTGSTRYALNIPKIPAVAISTNDAELLSDLLEDDPALEFFFETHCEMKEDKLSYNVIGQITGTEYPEEYLVVGGHLDSWDLAQGAHDDGTGCMQSIEVLRAWNALGYKPKRSIRAVMFMNEENGLRGGRKYAELATKNNEKHIAAMESDRGGFTPLGFSLDMDKNQLAKVKSWAPLFAPYFVYQFDAGSGGADISPLKPQGIPLIGYVPDSQRYFDYHHTGIDTFDKVNKRELHMGAATMASLLYLIDQYGL